MENGKPPPVVPRTRTFRARDRQIERRHDASPAASLGVGSQSTERGQQHEVGTLGSAFSKAVPVGRWTGIANSRQPAGHLLLWPWQAFERGEMSLAEASRLAPRLNATATTVNGGQTGRRAMRYPALGDKLGGGAMWKILNRARAFEWGRFFGAMRDFAREYLGISVASGLVNATPQVIERVSSASARFLKRQFVDRADVTRRVRPSAKSRCTTYVLAFDNRPKCNVSKEGACPTLSEMLARKSNRASPPDEREIFHATGGPPGATISNTGHLRGRAMSDIAFAKMVMKLAADVRALEDRTGPFGREAIRKKLNTARALSDLSGPRWAQRE